MDRQAKHIYEFGPFRLDAGERVLLREGVPVSLTPKALETLIVLVQNSGHLMNKDELMKTVWPDTFVEEGGLTRNISSLRKALGDDSGEQQYIETVPKRGYRFSAAVREMTADTHEIVVERHTRLRVITDEESVETETESKLLGRPKSRMSSRVAVLTSAVLILITTVVAIYLGISRKTERDGPLTSMAVLPLKDLTNGGDENENLGLVIADALITRLGSIKQLVVRPTSSILKYAGQSPDAAQIGKDLKVESVLDGSVRRIEGKVRVSLQLVSARDGSTLWAAMIDEESKDIFRLEDSIASRLTEGLGLTSANAEQVKSTKRGTDSIEAYGAYLKGRILWNKRTPDALKQSLVHFNSAIEHDPLYALAYAGLADSYVLLGEYNLSPPSETFPKAKAAAQRALDLDPNLGEAHTVFAYTLGNYDWNFSGSEQEYRRALELSPNYATAHQWYAEFFSLMRRFDEARREIKRAQEIDPLSPIIGSVGGLIEYHARNHEQAIVQLRRVIDLEPNFAPAHAYLSLAYEIKNMPDDAFAEQVKSFQLVGLPAQVIENFRQAYKRGGSDEYLTAVLDLMRALESQSIYTSPYAKATVYAKLGDREQALTYLEKAFDQHIRYVAYLNVDPSFDSLRDDPRFQDLLRRIGLKV